MQTPCRSSSASRFTPSRRPHSLLSVVRPPRLSCPRHRTYIAISGVSSPLSPPPPLRGPAATHLLNAPLNELEALWLSHVRDRCSFQYVVGNEHWKDLVVTVRDDVLIPRPETEAVMDMVATTDCDRGSWSSPLSSSAASFG
ncbi:hypothetical protein ZWY2020_016509 [Hordeum vulgare]|nr:hypothetical protein ZWY2020_016509 [Hordeum vulgare]